jgi:hypothetical protein
LGVSLGLNEFVDFSVAAQKSGATEFAQSSHIGHITNEVHSAVEVIFLARKMWENPDGCASSDGFAKPCQPSNFPQSRQPDHPPTGRELIWPPVRHASRPVRM